MTHRSDVTCADMFFTYKSEFPLQCCGKFVSCW